MALIRGRFQKHREITSRNSIPYIPGESPSCIINSVQSIMRNQTAARALGLATLLYTIHGKSAPRARAHTHMHTYMRGCPRVGPNSARWPLARRRARTYVCVAAAANPRHQRVARINHSPLSLCLSPLTRSSQRRARVSMPRVLLRLLACTHCSGGLMHVQCIRIYEIGIRRGRRASKYTVKREWKH